MTNQRATNLELQKWIARRHGFVVQSAYLDMYRQRLSTFAQSDDSTTAGLPPEQHIAIKQAFRFFGMTR